MKLMRFLLLFLSIAFIVPLNANTKNYTLKLKSGDETPLALDPNLEVSVLTNSHFNDGYAIVQFNQIPTSEEKQLIEQEGIQLLEFIPNYAFLAYSNSNSSKSIQDLNIRSITPYLVKHKTALRLANREFPDWADQGDNRIDLSIAIHLNVNYEATTNELIQFGATIIENDPSHEFLSIRINKSQIDQLIALPFVKFADFVPAPPEKEDTRARSLHRGNKLDSDHPLGRKYDGTGVSIAIADDGNIGPHIDFTGRVTQYTTTDRGTHGDMTSGIAVGSGNLDPRYRGMATGAYLHYYDISGYPHISGAVTNYNSRGVVITSTSYSQGCNSYENTARGIDQQVRQNPELLHVFSAGNSASSNCGYGAGTPWGTITGGRKQGKNVIATGNLEYQSALTSSSSRGPSEDGRIKPDICANGTNQISTDPNNTYAPGGGTSAAAPGIAGLAAQMYHGYRDLNGGNDPESGLIKSAMLNTARDLGNRGPDFFYGWGRVNVHRAMKLLEENRYTSSTISQNGQNTHNISVTQNLEQLRVMVYWTDYEGSTTASKALVNDIDIRLVTPNGDSIRPWVLNPSPNASSLNSPAVRGVDDLNNVEQVTLDTVPTGTYTVVVNGSAIPQGPQKYFLLWETRTDSIEVTYPSGGESFVPGETETIRWDAVDGTGNFTLQYSSNNGQSWNNIATVGGTRRYHNWSVPNITSGDVLVRITRNGITGQSEYPFSIMNQVSNFSVDFICPDSVRLRWSPTTGATSYIIYQLGNRYMDSIGTSTTTNFTLYNLNLANENWFSIKAIGNGIESRRNVAFQLPNQIHNCPLPYDINITQFNTPNIDYIPSCNVSKAEVKIVVNNAGDSTLINVPINLYANGNTYTDTIPGPLSPNSFSFFSFKDSILLTPGSKTISVAAQLPNDDNPANDSISTMLNVYNSISFTTPYNFDFETFIVCNTANNCGSTSCSLNNGWTNMPNNSVDDHDMRTDIGGTPSNNTGPSTDHNPGTSTGKYIYSEASGGCTGAESQVISPCFDLTNTIQPEFSFWYHMDGIDMGILRVDVLTEGAWVNNVITPIFGNQGSSWQQQTVDLTNYRGKTVNIRFRVTTGSDYRSDLAIDDVSLVDKALSVEEQNNDNAFTVYPNPSEGLFYIKTTTNLNQSAHLFDLNGRLVQQFNLKGKLNTLELDALQKGIYFLKIEGFKQPKKLIIY